jgi:hypothetical protein
MSLSFPVLKLVSESRNAHGLRLQDPVRYNAYCTKRVSTLKRALKFIQKSKKTAPKPITLELVQQDARYSSSSSSPANAGSLADQILMEGTLTLCCFLQNEHGVNRQA